jgi:inosose dehydratase
MATYRIGCGQITWRDAPEAAVLTDIAKAGYEGTPPKLRLEVPATEVIARLDAHGLKPAPPYFGASFWEPDEERDILDQAAAIARWVRELGCADLYVAAGGGGHLAPAGTSRRDVAGHVSPEDAMTERELDQFARVLSEFAHITRDEGVTTCFHNHVGTVIETADELDQLLTRADDEVVYLGLDTGHLAWAGADSVDVCRRYAGRIRTLHLKDVDDAVRRRGVEEQWDYDTFVRHGVFAELGEGDVDFPAIVSVLDGVDFDGWLIVETDVTQKPTALESATISRDYLRGIGL